MTSRRQSFIIREQTVLPGRRVGAPPPARTHRTRVQRRAGACGQSGSTTAHTVGVGSCGPEPCHVPGPWAAEPPQAGQHPDPGSRRPSLHGECRPWWSHVSMTPRDSGDPEAANVELQDRDPHPGREVDAHQDRQPGSAWLSCCPPHGHAPGRVS